MEPAWNSMIWNQFGAAIDMLENALDACPDAIWSDRSRRPEYWYIAYHTLFWLDLYLTGSVEGFAPRHPFTLEELDPTGVLPAQVPVHARASGGGGGARALSIRLGGGESCGAVSLQYATRPAPCRAVQPDPPAVGRCGPRLGRKDEERRAHLSMTSLLLGGRWVR